MKFIAIAAWVVLGAAASGAAVAAAATPDPAVIDADNAFGLKLLKVLRAGGAENVAISPTSLTMALQLVFGGARGPTRQAMAAALQLNGLTSENVDTANQALQASLAAPGPQIQLSIANSLWLRRGGRDVAPSFMQTAKHDYAAEIGGLAGAPDNVNAWISQKTQGLIPRLLPAKDYGDAVALIVNAIYFKGTWTSPFDPGATALAPFTTATGGRVNCPMMKQHEHVPYLEAADFRAIRLPYGAERRLSMVILLPNDAHSLEAVAAEATSDHLKQWLPRFRSTSVDISLPRFKVSYQKSLRTALQALGMGMAFDSRRADFSGIAPATYLSDVEHAALVQVDESGTTATAATGATVSLTALATSPVVFIVDHPFFFAIVDDATGALLFVGTVGNPG